MKPFDVTREQATMYAYQYGSPTAPPMLNPVVRKLAGTIVALYDELEMNQPMVDGFCEATTAINFVIEQRDGALSCMDWLLDGWTWAVDVLDSGEERWSWVRRFEHRSMSDQERAVMKEKRP